MKKLKRWLKEYFNPEEFNDLDTDAIRSAFNDAAVRTVWLSSCLEEIKRIHLEVDQRLLSGTQWHLSDLCARRRAYQDVLEAVLSARRRVAGTQEGRPNPQDPGKVDLDRVTA